MYKVHRTMKVMGKVNMELLFTKALKASTREHSGILGKISLKQASAWLVANIWKSRPWEAAKVNGTNRFTRGLDTSMDSRYSGACAGPSQ